MAPSGVLATTVRLMAGSGARLRRDLGGVAALELINLAMTALGPYSLKVLVDRLGAGPLPPLTLALLVGLFVLASGASIAATLKLVFVQRIIDAMQARLVADALAERLPASATGRDGDSGKLLGLLERLPYSLQIVVDGLIWRVVPLALQVLLSLAVVGALIPWRYALILAATLGLYVLATWAMGRRHRLRAGAANAAAGALTQLVGDVARNARRVVLNGALPLELAHIGARLAEKRQATERMTWSLSGLAAMQYAVVGLGLMILLWLGGRDVGAGRLTVGDFVLLQAFAFRLALPLSAFGFILSQAAVALANVGEVLDLAKRTPGAPDARIGTDGPARLEVVDVGFRYGPHLPGLDAVTLTIEPGSLTVLVGPNGSGKSTLAQIMAGLLEPDTGHILVSGHALADIPASARHDHILYVPQFVSLLNRSLGENAHYPPALHDGDELVRLLEAWQFYEPGRPIDLTLAVGEQGERLSGGQIQKLELARLTGIVKPALILDESTSALDPQAEATILAHLRGRLSGRTTLVVISHRIGVAAMADQVLYLARGRVRAAGRHEDLLASNDEYRHFWTDGQEKALRAGE